MQKRNTIGSISSAMVRMRSFCFPPFSNSTTRFPLQLAVFDNTTCQTHLWFIICVLVSLFLLGTGLPLVYELLLLFGSVPTSSTPDHPSPNTCFEPTSLFEATTPAFLSRSCSHHLSYPPHLNQHRSYVKFLFWLLTYRQYVVIWQFFSPNKASTSIAITWCCSLSLWHEHLISIHSHSLTRSKDEIHQLFAKLLKPCTEFYVFPSFCKWYSAY